LQACGVRVPIVRFTGAEVSQSTAEAIALRAEFEISNTNDEPLRLKFYEYTVHADGHTVYRGRISPGLTVPRWTTVESHIPIVIRRENLTSVGTLTGWKLSGTLSYYPPSAIADTLMNLGIWQPKTSVRAQDEFEVPRIN